LNAARFDPPTLVESVRFVDALRAFLSEKAPPPVDFAGSPRHHRQHRSTYRSPNCRYDDLIDRSRKTDTGKDPSMSVSSIDFTMKIRREAVAYSIVLMGKRQQQERVASARQ
jgi:hypothetical protein